MYAKLTVYKLFIYKAFGGRFFNPKKLKFLGVAKFQILKPQSAFLEWCVTVHLHRVIFIAQPNEHNLNIVKRSFSFFEVLDSET